MPEQNQESSRTILEAIPQFEELKFDANVMNDFYKEVEEKMKKFDLEKIQIMTHSTTDLFKSIIS